MCLCAMRNVQFLKNTTLQSQSQINVRISDSEKTLLPSEQRALLHKMFYTSDTSDSSDKFQVCSEKTFLPSERPSSQCASQWVQFPRTYYFTITRAGLLFSINFCRMDGLLILLASSSFPLKRSYSSPGQRSCYSPLGKSKPICWKGCFQSFLPWAPYASQYNRSTCLWIYCMQNP